MPYFPPTPTFELVEDTSPQLGGNLDLNGFDIAAKQNANSNLTALSGISSAADRLPYFTGVGTMNWTALTSYIRTLLDDSDASGARTTLDIEDGTYSPSFTNVANVSSFGTVNSATYLRIGNTVVVSGRVSIDAISASVNTQFRMTLPVSSNFTLFADCGGVVVSKNSVSLVGAVLADTSNDQANFQYINTTDVAAREFAFIYQYLIK